MDPITAAALRRPFPPEQVGKLPRVTCSACRQSSSKVCDKHRKEECPSCKQWMTSGHMHLDYVGHAATTDRLLEADPDWTWEPFAVGPDGLPALDRNGALWIRLTVGGVTRIGVGDSENGKGAKELIGDALRNAAMRFGVALDLWSKEDLAQQHIVTDVEWLTATVDLIVKAESTDDLDAVARRIVGAVNVDAVNPQDRRDLADAWRARKADLDAEATA